jgi:hypothetical protein
MKIRKTHIGTELLYHSQDEIRALLKPHFKILREEIINLVGKGVFQPGNFFLAEKL